MQAKQPCLLCCACTMALVRWISVGPIQTGHVQMHIRGVWGTDPEPQQAQHLDPLAKLSLV